MQRNYGRNQIPNLKKRSGIMDQLDSYYLDPKSCLIVLTLVIIIITGIMCVAAIPNSNVPVNV